MGCDIHIFIERKNKLGKWTRVSESKGPKDPYYDPNETSAEYKNFFDRNTWTTGRNYLLFGLLAGVRAYNILPIAEPKGIPFDVSSGIAKEWKKWGADGHTPSWLTAKELLDFKDKPIKYRTCLSIDLYKEFLKNGKNLLPRSSVSIWEREDNIKNIISNAEMERYISLSAFWDGTEYLTDVIWEATDIDRTNFNHLFNEILPTMLKVESDPEKIRMVFWFDN